MRPPISRLRSSRPGGSPRISALLLALMLALAAPLMSGCLERSTTVGDRFAGSIIVATTKDNAQGAPTLDIPESMTSNVAIEKYEAVPDGGSSDEAAAVRVGTRATYSNLTAGQLSQLGDIIANAFGDTAMTVDLSAKRSGDVVRFRASADLAGLVAGRDYLQFTISFAGPITATSGNQSSDTTVSWTPEPGASSDLTAEATYPDPATAAFGGWSWLMALICAVVVAVVIRLAYVSRYRGPRPGRPANLDSGKRDRKWSIKKPTITKSTPTKSTPTKPTVSAASATDAGGRNEGAGGTGSDKS